MVRLFNIFKNSYTLWCCEIKWSFIVYIHNVSLLIIMKEMDEEKIVGGFRKAVQDFLVPELREVVGELKQMNKRLASVENSISELRADIREDRREVLQKIDDSHEKTREVLIEEIRKSAKLEVRIDEIEKR